MDKNAIKKFAVWARKELIERVSKKALAYGITEHEVYNPDADSVNGLVLTAAQKKERKALTEQIFAKGYKQVMEEVAYTWFNRFCALRFMEVNGFLPSLVRVFTNDKNEFRPQLLTEALELDLPGLDKQKIYELKEANADEELYKYLLITQCNALNDELPRMFQRIEDYTELLFPDNLLREGSVIEQMITLIPEEDWQDAVQIIGWLYQYYNIEPKKEVFANLDKNIKIGKNDIPAATQLFTPDWIVRYMVENSLGRLVTSNQCIVNSGQEIVNSGQCIVDSESSVNNQLSTKNYSLTTTNYPLAAWKYYLPEAEQEIVNSDQCIVDSESSVNNQLSTNNSSLSTIAQAYQRWKAVCNERFAQLKANEEELNRIFIDIYGLQDELTPEVEEKDVTVHRIFDSKDDVPEAMKGSNYILTQQQVVKSLISYAVGCMFGRYSLDKPGLVYAGGEWDAGNYQTFAADKDAIIPISDNEYFNDDIVARFVEFIRTAFGADEKTLEANLNFIAAALGGNGSARDVIRAYFNNGFYADHCKTYQKRPIYWLFDSGKKNGFKCLIYMHRYQKDTIARIRTDYLHEQQSRYRTAISDLQNRIDNAVSTGVRVKLQKQLATVQAQVEEARLYEEKIHHLADQMLEIDLDDGVKHNYAIFKDVLAKIK